MTFAMMEAYAHRFTGQSELAILVETYGLMIAGGLFAAILWRGKGELPRIPYFACVSLVLLLYVASQFVWLFTFQAIVGGYLVAIVGLYLLSSVIFGFAIGVLAMARSRDAFGQARWAFLMFIPIFGFFILLFAKGDDLFSSRQMRYPAIFSGTAGVITGCILMTAVIVVRIALPGIIERNSRGQGAFVGADLSDFKRTVARDGVEKSLEAMANAVDLPMKINDELTVIAVESDGTTLRFTYSAVSDAIASEQNQNAMTELMCANPTIEVVLEAGGSFKRDFLLRSDGSMIASVVVDRQACGY